MPEHRDRVVELLRQVVAIPTAYPPGDATQISAASVSQLKRLGYRTDAHAEVAGLVNVVASIGEGAPHLVFNAHVDTVTFTFVTDEESLGERGMAYLRNAGLVKPDMLFLGAPTSNALITSERGAMWVCIETSGKAAHTGAPEMGDNAVQRVLRLVAYAQRAPLPRLAVWRDADSGEPDGTRSSELMRGTKGFASARDSALVTTLAAAVARATRGPARFAGAIDAGDSRWSADDGIEIASFGPGGSSEEHAANEFVGLAELESSATINPAFVEQLAGLRG